MARRLELPLIHLDRHYWRPGWSQPTREVWEEQVRALVDADAWIMDGNYGGSLHIRVPRAEAVVLLDFPPWRCVGGVLRRRLTSALVEPRPDLPDDLPDRLTLDFLVWIWRYPTDSRPRVEAALEGVDVPVHRLGSRRQVRAFLDGLPRP